MVWIVEKKVFYHSLDLDYDRVEIPIRTKFEFEVKDGGLVLDSLSRDILYNHRVLERRYPDLDLANLQKSIENTVDREIDKYLRGCGYLDAERQRKHGTGIERRRL